MRYHTDHGHPIPDYVCQRRGIQNAEPLCQRLPGAHIDQALTELVLKAVNPASLEVALEVFEELRTRKAEIDRLRRAQVERAREEAELAQRQYLLARPENRLVVDNLERQWNEKLTSLAQAEEEYSRMSKSQPSALTDADRNRIHALASDLPRVWNDPRTPARDRKRMLRLLIEDVTLVKNQNIQIHIRWKAGATTSRHLVGYVRCELRITASISESLAGAGLRQGANDWLKQHEPSIISTSSAQYTFSGEALGSASVHSHLRSNLGGNEPAKVAKMLDVGWDAVGVANVPND